MAGLEPWVVLLFGTPSPVVGGVDGDSCERAANGSATLFKPLLVGVVAGLA